LKSFFTNEAKFATQFVISKKLQDVKKAGSMMFNIVEQINIKMGGANFYIDLVNDKIIDNIIYLCSELVNYTNCEGEDDNKYLIKIRKYIELQKNK